jgi:hypothetical protein
MTAARRQYRQAFEAVAAEGAEAARTVRMRAQPLRRSQDNGRRSGEVQYQAGRPGRERAKVGERRSDPGASKQDYIGVSRTTFSTLASSTVSLDRYSSAAT